MKGMRILLVVVVYVLTGSSLTKPQQQVELEAIAEYEGYFCEMEYLGDFIIHDLQIGKHLSVSYDLDPELIYKNTSIISFNVADIDWSKVKNTGLQFELDHCSDFKNEYQCDLQKLKMEVYLIRINDDEYGTLQSCYERVFLEAADKKKETDPINCQIPHLENVITQWGVMSDDQGVFNLNNQEFHDTIKIAAEQKVYLSFLIKVKPDIQIVPNIKNNKHCLIRLKNHRYTYEEMNQVPKLIISY